jgi:hypothetical protein
MAPVLMDALQRPPYGASTPDTGAIHPIRLEPILANWPLFTDLSVPVAPEGSLILLVSFFGVRGSFEPKNQL